MDLQFLTQAIDQLSLPPAKATPSPILLTSSRAQHRTALLLSISQTKESHASLEEQTNRLLDLQQKLKSCYLALEQALSPIESLPPELLLTIFDYVVHSSEFAADAARTLSHVSSRWRAVSIDAPSLWSTMTFHSPFIPSLYGFVQICLQRTDKQPLDMVLCHRSNYRTSDTFVFGTLCHAMLLEGVKNRIRSLDISIDTPESMPLEWDLPDEFPSLENLTIDTNNNHSEDDSALRQWVHYLVCPKLRRLEVRWMNWPGIRKPMDAITSITLHGSFMAVSALRSIFEHPRLEHLCIRKTSFWGDWSTLPDNVLFPHLHTLTLEELDASYSHQLLLIIHPGNLKQISLELPAQSPRDFIEQVTQYLLNHSSIEHMCIGGLSPVLAQLFLMMGSSRQELDSLHGPFFPLLESLEVKATPGPPIEVETLSGAVGVFLDGLGPDEGVSIATRRALKRLSASAVILDHPLLEGFQRRCGEVIRL